MDRLCWIARGYFSGFVPRCRSPQRSLPLLVLVSGLLIILSAMARAGGTPAVAAPPGQASQQYPTRWLEGDVEIDDELFDTLDACGTVDLFVRMRHQADLSAAAAIDAWGARGRYVYDALRAAADAQAPVAAYAEVHGLAHETRLGNNSVFIQGATRADLQALAARPDVYQILANRLVELEPADTAPQAGTSAAGWNLGALDPAAGLYGMQAVQVWQQVGVRGEGIVVANIDTGVTYQHEALDRQYRGNLTGAVGGPYDHNYNWYQPVVTGTCGDGTYPCDWQSHGSGDMGLLVGETADLVEQIGVAPGARWIACMGCEGPGCSTAALTACMDWMLAPTDVYGANPDPAMRPHVISNMWGSLNPPCYAGWVPWLQAWWAAGIFPAFNVGGGASCWMIGTPADQAYAFGPGAHASGGANLYGGGPGACFPDPICVPGASQVKPNVNAPTFGRTASNVPGVYYDLGGAGGAVPHAAGTVALVWSANPALIGNLGETFRILEASANKDVPAGNCGEPSCAVKHVPNYEYGWGYLDAYAAVTMAVGGNPGWLEGTVTGTGRCDAGSYPLEIDVLVENSAGMTWTVPSDATGYYHEPLPSDTYTVTFGATGHVPTPTEVQVQAAMTTTLDAALRARVPCIAVTPDVFSLTLPVEVVYTDVLTIANAGAGELVWAIEEVLPVRMVDVPWVREVPAAGVVLADSTVHVDVVFDSGGLVAGECYTAALDLVHDDTGLPSPKTLPLVLCLEGARPAVTLKKDVAPEASYPGEVVTFTIVAANGGGPLAGGVVTDALPVGVAYATSDPPGAHDGAGHRVVWDGVEVGGGEQVTLTVWVTAGGGVTPGRWLTNVAVFRWEEAGAAQIITAIEMSYLDIPPEDKYYVYLPVVVRGE